MEKRKGGCAKALARFISYILVAALASMVTLIIFEPIFSDDGSTRFIDNGKLAELEELIMEMYIGDADQTVMEDAAADAMVNAIGDRWSYYIPASDVQYYEEQKANSYVGIGVTILQLEDGSGFQVQQVEPNSPAKEGGILPGDVIIAANNVSAVGIDTDTLTSIVKGEAGTDVDITVSRDGEELTFTLTRQQILVVVASGQMVTDTIGYVKINNFDERCYQETKTIIEELEEQGAKSLIFDVRFNPGGYKDELVKLLDYLLPEGDLFRSESYTGKVTVDTSDASCKEMPMAVLINGDSYSAAEFFAAALEEYDYAVTVGAPTTGKGYFQTTMVLSDGSAVNLSVGKYFTPKGVSLAEVGGLVPNVLVEVDEETNALIYGQMLEIGEDPQIQAAIAALQDND